MERTQFTFYESFFRAISRIKKEADQAKAYNAICNYALYEIEPDLDSLPDAVAIAFISSKPNLDASRKKAKSGKKGGERKQPESKPEANGKQTASEKENEKENEKEKEDECPPLPPVGGVEAVLDDYLDRINPTASPNSLDELRGYAEELGEAVCRRAFDVALDSKNAKWPYIRGILRRLQSQGVRCLADWEAIEKAREANGQSGGSYREAESKPEFRVGTYL